VSEAPLESGALRAESIVVNETRINYRHNLTGAREVALLLHGLGGDHRGLVQVAAGLRDVDVVIPDLPGYGDSAPLTVPHSLANYAATVEALRVALDLGPVHLIGHSLGASIALLHAATHSQPPAPVGSPATPSVGSPPAPAVPLVAPPATHSAAPPSASRPPCAASPCSTRSPPRTTSPPTSASSTTASPPRSPPARPGSGWPANPPCTSRTS
jgi:pimeloyl-ACP methyl ester carboxylesterase